MKGLLKYLGYTEHGYIGNTLLTFIYTVFSMAIIGGIAAIVVIIIHK